MTHPWIKFTLDPREFTPKLWMLLGECKSKCDHVAGVPLLPDTADKINRHYLARGAKATTAIEGNSLTVEQVELEVEMKPVTLPESQAYLVQEVRNIAHAYDQIFFDVSVRGKGGPIGLPSICISPARICGFNKIVLHDLPLERHVVPGEIRKHAIAVGMYRGAPTEDCEYLLDRMSEWIETLQITDDSPIVNGIVKALLAHLYIAWIHPFSDGNGRTARLVEYQLLLQAGIPAPAVHLMSDHFNATRAEYYRQLEEASISGGDVIPFLAYAVRGFRDGLIEQLQYIRDQQVEVMWRDHLMRTFGDPTTAGDRRRLDLILDITALGKPVRPSDVTSVSGRIAKSYATRTDKTVSRDIAGLTKRKLLVVDENGNLIPNKRIILSYLPPVAG